jgi:hypothetical protein
VDFDTPREDCSVLEIPTSTVGYVMGSGGKGLRRLEEEWGTLMFFAKNKHGRRDSSRGDSNEKEKLAIFGNRRGRRGAELKVMSSVEHKEPGYYVNTKADPEVLRERLNQPGEDTEDWGYTTMNVSEADFSYALGQGGTTRKKLAAASGAILEFVGFVAVVCGTKAERLRGVQYLDWLIAQKSQRVTVEPTGRTDCLVVEVPRAAVGFVTGHRGASLRRIEGDTKTFCFASGNKDDTDKEMEKLLVFGASASGRSRAKEIILDMVDEKKNGFRGGRRDDYDRRDARDHDRDRRDYDRRDSRDHDRDRRDYDRRDDHRRGDRRDDRRDDYDRRDRGRDHRRDSRDRDRDRRDSYDDRDRRRDDRDRRRY